MPAKNTQSILMHEDTFLSAKNANNEKDLEKHLTEIMTVANGHYNTVYRMYKNNPNIEKFSFCKENFQKIKSIIESKGNSTALINKIYLEAWISTLYSDVHALNLDPETEEELIKLNEKILAIGIDFIKLQTKKASLDSKDENSVTLLEYIDDFEQTWKTKEKRLLADSHYNFAETLVEKSKIELKDKANGQINQVEAAMKFLAKAVNFYKQANLSKSADQTEQRIKELEITAQKLQNSSKNNHFTSHPNKKLVVVLRRTSPPLKHAAITWTASYKETPKETSDKLPKVLDQSILPIVTQKIAASDAIKPTQRKRESFDNDIKPAKKVKIDPAIAPHHKIKSQWKKECEHLLNEFSQMRINDKLEGILNPFHKKSFNERRAIACNNYAITIIMDLINSKKNAADSEKLELLEKAKKQFLNSSNFYTQTNLLKEKDKAKQCINILTLSIKKLASIASTNEKTTFDKPVVSDKKLVLPIRDTRTFFKNLSCPENNAIKVENQQNSGKLVYSPLSLR
ncbi:hypothetical protein [Rickettsiella endosymbiont of Aleochara curtula]|uniref:hypothetical protein n=1 Tax=Rickettsiella endosymbiont of Aleochara curtula TaxID=3077936 RepID=UPI00313AE2AC